MCPRHRMTMRFLACCLAFSLMQVFIRAASPSTLPFAKVTAALPPQGVIGRLTTRGNASVLVNGNRVSTGTTILTGATLETGDNVGATVMLGPLGSLDIGPNTKLTLEYDSQGNVRVALTQGCMILKTNKRSSGEVKTSAGTAGKIDKASGGFLDVCFPPGSTAPIVNQGAAAQAGAGASTTSSTAASTAVGTASSSGWLTTSLIIFGAVVGTGFATSEINRNQNPSPSRP